MKSFATIITTAAAIAAISSSDALSANSGRKLLKTVTYESFNGPPGVSVNNTTYQLPGLAPVLKCPAKAQKCLIEIEMTINWVVGTTGGFMGTMMSINGVSSTSAGGVAGTLAERLISHWKFARTVNPGNYTVRFFGVTDTPQFLAAYSVTATIYKK